MRREVRRMFREDLFCFSPFNCVSHLNSKYRFFARVPKYIFLCKRRSFFFGRTLEMNRLIFQQKPPTLYLTYLHHVEGFSDNLIRHQFKELRSSLKLKRLPQY